MHKVFISLVVFLVVFVTHVQSAFAGGGVFTNQYVQVAQTESRAVIIFDGKKETILDSFTFNINSISQDNFVWVIPIPSKPEVEPIKDELYVKFEKLTEKKIQKDALWQKLLYFDIDEEKTLPSQFFTRPVDIWKFDIVEPDYEKLNLAVREMGYFVPKEGRPVLREYVNKGWYFVVAHVNALHIQMDASESLTTNGAHTLPLMIAFETDKPIYPIKLASIPSDPDSEYAGLGYSFGSDSESVLGDKDERIDELLSEPSKNKFPSLPLDYVNMKIELFVLAGQKMTAEGFSTGYANWIDASDINFKDLRDNQYIDLPQQRWYLTRLFTYKPLFQVEDVELLHAPITRRVNARVSIWIQMIKLTGIITLGVVTFFFLKKFVAFFIAMKKIE